MMSALKIIITIIVAGLFSSPVFAVSSDSGSATVNGKTLAYMVTGDSVSASVTTDNGKHSFEATVDGVRHEVEADAQELRWNEQTVELTGFEKIEVVINHKSVEVRVDGKRMLPVPEEV